MDSSRVFKLNRACPSSVVLCSHTLRAPGATLIRVQLHEGHGKLHILVQQFTSAGDELRRTNNIKILLEGATTEYITEFYVAYLSSLDPRGCFIKEGHTLLTPGTTAVSLPEKKGDTGMEVLSQFFHLPINEASKALGICSTSLKKICRKHGLLRWPHRKVKSMENKFAKVAKEERLQHKRRTAFETPGPFAA